MALIVGISGACRKHELCQLTVDDVEDLGSAVIVRIHNSKNKTSRSFTITGQFYTFLNKYTSIRPSNVPNRRFFLNYRQEKCTKQPVGINKLGSVPKVVAKYLHLNDPELYTSHCLRRTSATILVDAGGDITALKRHGGWKSTSVAETYIDESITNKLDVSEKILNAVNLPSSSHQNLQPTHSCHDTQSSGSRCNIQTSNSYMDLQDAQSRSNLQASSINNINQRNLSHTVTSQNMAHPINFTNCSNNQITVNFYNTDVTKD